MANERGYTVADLVFYSGLFAGIILTYLGLEAAEVEIHRIVKLIIGLVVGLGLGWVCLKIYESMTKPPSPPEDRDYLEGP